jgi:N-acetylmuramoyl-L-alanine amidase
MNYRKILALTAVKRFSSIMNRIAACALFIVLVSILTGSAADRSIPIKTIEGARYIPLYDIVTVMGLSLSYDPITRRGKILQRAHQAVFLEDCARMIIDGRLYTAKNQVIRHDEEIMIPVELFDIFANSFFDEYSMSEETGKFVFREKTDDEKKTSPPKKEQSHAKYFQTSADKIGFIIIDAGHGGKDPGAVGKGKVYEKTITLAVAKRIGAIIKQKHPGMKVYFTRSKDVFVELGARTEYANRKLTQEMGGIFVSIHVNASIVPKMTGFETYFLSQNPTNEEARSTAALENDVVILENPGRQKSYDDIAQIEALMLTTQIQRESRQLADKIQRAMGANKSFPSRGVKTADFFVLRGSLMPATLVEIGYITNKKELTRLIDEQYQEKIARSIAQGISDFLSKYGQID